MLDKYRDYFCIDEDYFPASLFALNFIIGGVIGGFVLAWRLIVAVWYVPLTVYRLIVG